jgi:hypothetical protein
MSGVVGLVVIVAIAAVAAVAGLWFGIVVLAPRIARAVERAAGDEEADDRHD